MTTPTGVVPNVCGTPSTVLATWVRFSATVPAMLTGSVAGVLMLTSSAPAVFVIPVVPLKIEALTPGTAAAAGAVPKFVTAVAPSVVPATWVMFVLAFAGGVVVIVPVTATELFGLIATTRALSVATAAVEAGFTATGPVVPSVSSVGHAFASVFAVPWFAVTVPATVWLAGELITATEPLTGWG